MTSTVFILGAGASRAAGGPLMVDFLDIAEDMFEGMRQSQEPNSVRDSFELVFREIHKLQEVYARSTLDLNNIESVFAAFEMATLLGRLGDLTRQEVQQLAPAMRHLIVCTLEGRIPLKSENDRFTPVPYEEFAKLLLDMIHFANMSVSVITFNYDLALDYALSQHKTLGPVDYGLDLEGGKGRIPGPEAPRLVELGPMWMRRDRAMAITGLFSDAPRAKSCWAVANQQQTMEYSPGNRLTSQRMWPLR